MGKFEDRLWRELVRKHGAELSQIERLSGQARRRARPRLLAGTTLGLAGIGTAIVLILTAASTPAAFAVNRNSDGTVSVQIKQLAGINGANEKLAALGVRARVVQAVPGCKAGNVPLAMRRALKAAVLLRARSASWIHAQARATARIDPTKIPAGATLVLPTARVGRQIHVGPHWFVHVAPDCLPIPLPPAAAGIVSCGVPRPGLPGHVEVLPPGAGTGNSGDSGAPGNSGTPGNSGNSGTTTTTTSTTTTTTTSHTKHGKRS